MGLPKLIFTTAGSDSSTPTWGDNQYGEVKSSKSPRVGKFGTDDAVPAEAVLETPRWTSTRG